MEKTLNLNYQYSLFGNFSDISPEKTDIVIELLKLYENENFIPSSYQEIVLNNGIQKPENRIALNNKDGIAINIGFQRIDVIVSYNEDGKYKDMKIEEITPKVTNLLEKFLDKFNRVCNRLALNTTTLLSDEKTIEIEKKFEENSRTIEYYNTKKVREWIERLVTREKNDNIGEEINIITSLNRTNGEFYNQVLNKNIAFDSIIVQFDINTLAENINPRFKKEEMKNFFDNAIIVKKEIEDKF